MGGGIIGGMIRPIMTSQLILGRPSEEATAADLPVAEDLLDTLAVHRDRCVGMAANMIGVRKRIIVFVDGPKARVMLNPEIVSAQGPYDTEEGCLSLVGKRPAKRYKRIKVSYLDTNLRPHTEGFSDFTAQIIQHEVDHCNGIVV
jgi:peptide deformylase